MTRAILLSCVVLACGCKGSQPRLPGAWGGVPFGVLGPFPFPRAPVYDELREAIAAAAKLPRPGLAINALAAIERRVERAKLAAGHRLSLRNRIRIERGKLLVCAIPLERELIELIPPAQAVPAAPRAPVVARARPAPRFAPWRHRTRSY